MNEQAIREITEDVKRDQMLALWKRYQGLIIAAVLAVLIGVGGQQGYKAYQQSQAAKASAAFVAASKLEDEQKLPEAAKAFEESMKNGTPGIGALSGLRLAAIYGQQGNRQAQLDTLKAVATQNRFDPAQREVALLVWAYEMLAAGKQAEAEKTVKDMLKNSAYPGLLKEWLAMAALKNNDSTAAKILLGEIATDAEAPESLKQRAQGILSVIETSAPATKTEKPDA